MRKIMKLAASTLAASAATAALFAGPVAVAHAEASLDVGDTAVLVSKGAAVLIPVDLACDGSVWAPGALVSVSVRERSGNRIADGVGSASLPCDGTAHSADVLVTAGDVPFKPGTALVTVNAFVCDELGCRSLSDTSEVRIRNQA